MNNIMNELEQKLISMSENDYGYSLYSDDNGNETPLELDPYAEEILKNGKLFINLGKKESIPYKIKVLS